MSVRSGKGESQGGSASGFLKIPKCPLDNQNRCAILDANRVVGGRPFPWEGRRTGNPVRVRDGPRRCNRVFKGSSQSPSHCRVRQAGPVAGTTTRRLDKPNSEVRRPTNAGHAALREGRRLRRRGPLGTHSSSASCGVAVFPVFGSERRWGAPITGFALVLRCWTVNVWKGGETEPHSLKMPIDEKRVQVPAGPPL